MFIYIWVCLKIGYPTWNVNIVFSIRTVSFSGVPYVQTIHFLAVNSVIVYITINDYYQWLLSMIIINDCYQWLPSLLLVTMWECVKTMYPGEHQQQLVFMDVHLPKTSICRYWSTAISFNICLCLGIPIEWPFNRTDDENDDRPSDFGSPKFSDKPISYKVGPCVVTWFKATIKVHNLAYMIIIYIYNYISTYLPNINPWWCFPNNRPIPSYHPFCAKALWAHRCYHTWDLPARRRCPRNMACLGYDGDIMLIYIYTVLVGGWPTPLKNMKVSWDDDIPNIWKNKKLFQTTNQYIYVWLYMYIYIYTHTHIIEINDRSIGIHEDSWWFIVIYDDKTSQPEKFGHFGSDSPFCWQSFQSQGREAVIIHPDLCLVGWFMDHGWPSLEDFSMNHESWMTCGSLWMIQFMNDRPVCRKGYYVHFPFIHL